MHINIEMIRLAHMDNIDVSTLSVVSIAVIALLGFHLQDYIVEMIRLA